MSGAVQSSKSIILVEAVAVDEGDQRQVDLRRVDYILLPDDAVPSDPSADVYLTCWADGLRIPFIELATSTGSEVGVAGQTLPEESDPVRIAVALEKAVQNEDWREVATFCRVLRSPSAIAAEVLPGIFGHRETSCTNCTVLAGQVFSLWLGAIAVYTTIFPNIFGVAMAGAVMGAIGVATVAQCQKRYFELLEPPPEKCQAQREALLTLAACRESEGGRTKFMDGVEEVFLTGYFEFAKAMCGNTSLATSDHVRSMFCELGQILTDSVDILSHVSLSILLHSLKDEESHSWMKTDCWLSEKHSETECQNFWEQHENEIRNHVKMALRNSTDTVLAKSDMQKFELQAAI